ncbi:Haloacid dehalogenase-like hydrolase-domain-containing protein [Phyllosticta citribraziliensis]|uniref:Haloacid dehalogenase-like hydrolase-domain-containing protein n=1 Tax=Phyllosticta citribraziliensis TaxID=989973 RepID=A0ABR1LT45_9PEZI
MAVTRPKNIIFDIGDVFCSWTPPTTPTISPKLLKEFLDSPTWHAYDCGSFGQEECYTRLAEQFGVAAADIAHAFQRARDSLAQEKVLVDTILELRRAHPELKVFAMSNISGPDWAYLKKKEFNWEIFDRVFTSCEAGMSKPDLRFYRLVLEQANASPSETVFVDDKLENVIAARSLGVTGIVCENSAEVRRKLLNLLSDPVQRGKEWLQRNKKTLYSQTDNGVVVRDNFAQLLAFEVTGDLDLFELRYHDRTWNYFIDTLEGFPNDVDTTSYAYKLLPLDPKMAHSIIDEMLSSKGLTGDGILKVYFYPGRARTDPTVCINALRLLYKYGRGNEEQVKPTKDWIHNVLFYRAYLQGTRYYHSPDTFLYFFARLLAENPGSDMYRSTAALLQERLRERTNVQSDALELGMRIVACHLMGIRDDLDLVQLLDMQAEDGSFEMGYLCMYGKTGVKLGHRGLTTALAIRAVEASVPSKSSSANQEMGVHRGRSSLKRL